jgi:O-6-methylguanine DNA methyltransferase
MMTIAEEVYQVVMKIPRGKVSTYGKIAKTLGIGARQVGYILHRNENPKVVPCHRVVKSGGEIASGYAFGGQGKQQEILMVEGVRFEKGKVVKEDLI